MDNTIKINLTLLLIFISACSVTSNIDEKASKELRQFYLTPDASPQSELLSNGLIPDQKSNFIQPRGSTRNGRFFGLANWLFGTTAAQQDFRSCNCPTCPFNPACPTCPTCPAITICPTCPVCPVCPTCPTCLALPSLTTSAVCPSAAGLNAALGTITVQHDSTAPCEFTITVPAPFNRIQINCPYFTTFSTATGAVVAYTTPPTVTFAGTTSNIVALNSVTTSLNTATLKFTPQADTNGVFSCSWQGVV